jgi:WD40 repeat protein
VFLFPNPASCATIAKLPPNHQNPPFWISSHPTLDLAISCSISEAVIWNTELWSRLRILSGQIKQAAFSPDGTSIIVAFDDSSVYFWTVNGFNLMWKISVSINVFVKPQVNHFAVSSKGEFLIYEGL